MTLFQTVLTPIIINLSLFLLQLVSNSNQLKGNLDPSSTLLEGVYPCQVNYYLLKGNKFQLPCISIMYTPNVEPFNSFMNTFSELNEKRTNVRFAIEPPISGIIV